MSAVFNYCLGCELYLLGKRLGTRPGAAVTGGWIVLGALVLDSDGVVRHRMIGAARKSEVLGALQKLSSSAAA